MIDCGRPIVFQLLPDIFRRRHRQIAECIRFFCYFFVGIILLFSFDFPGQIYPLFCLPLGYAFKCAFLVFLGCFLFFSLLSLRCRRSFFKLRSVGAPGVHI